MAPRIRGLIAPPHTAMHADGRVNLAPIERQAELLIASGVRGAFVCGATGEFASLSFEERDAVARRWLDVIRDTELVAIVQVGGNQLREARELAGRAAAGGADAIAALAPFLYRPATVEELVDCCAAIAGGAPGLPFYYYEIPELTGVRLPMDDFVERARERIPGFAGLKFTSTDLAQLQKCVALAGDELDVLYGKDEALLAAIQLGVGGAVGSTYNFAAGLYRRMKRAFDAGDMERARIEQRRSIRLVELLASYGYMGAAKAVMGFLGVDCGPPRLPVRSPSKGELARLRVDLENSGFFDWRRDDPGSGTRW